MYENQYDISNVRYVRKIWKMTIYRDMTYLFNIQDEYLLTYRHRKRLISEIFRLRMIYILIYRNLEMSGQ